MKCTDIFTRFCFLISRSLLKVGYSETLTKDVFFCKFYFNTIDFQIHSLLQFLLIKFNPKKSKVGICCQVNWLCFNKLAYFKVIVRYQKPLFCRFTKMCAIVSNTLKKRTSLL